MSNPLVPAGNRKKVRGTRRFGDEYLRGADCRRGSATGNQPFPMRERPRTRFHGSLNFPRCRLRCRDPASYEFHEPGKPYLGRLIRNTPPYPRNTGPLLRVNVSRTESSYPLAVLSVPQGVYGNLESSGVFRSLWVEGAVFGTRTACGDDASYD